MGYVYSVNICESSMTLKKGQSGTASVAVCAECDICETVRWYSEDKSIATVDEQTGLIRAMGAGTTKIYAQSLLDGNYKDFVEVTVEPTLVSSVTLGMDQLTLKQGAHVELPICICPEDADNKSLFWCSSNGTVAEVDANGTVTSKAQGYATIMATAQDGSGKSSCCNIYVTDELLVSSVLLNKSNETVETNDSFQLQATVLPTEATDKELLWSSSNPTVAMVDQDGRVTALAMGRATITAAAQDGSEKKATCVVTVRPYIPVEYVLVEGVETIMGIDQTVTLSAVVCPVEATNQAVTWLSSDESVASFESNTGTLKAKKVGKTTIQARSADGIYSNSYEIEVFIDTVTIKQDGWSTSVYFKNSGKIWKCINEDRVFNIPAERDMLDKRSSYNYFANYNENEKFQSDPTPKVYSEEELKLLYAIDPLGVADYVCRYATANYDNVRDNVEYKDSIFRLLFGKEPLYYDRLMDGSWVITYDKSNINVVVSESESIFGMHNLLDHYFVANLLNVLITFAELAITFMTVPGAIAGAMTTVIKQTTKKTILKQVMKGLQIAYHIAWDGLVSTVEGEALEKLIEEAPLNWVYTIITQYSSLRDALNVFSSPNNFCKQQLQYCLNKLNYDIYLELGSEASQIEIVNLREIQSRLQQPSILQ